MSSGNVTYGAPSTGGCTVKGAVFAGDRRVEVRDFPKPEPGPGEVVLKMMASGLCGSDLARYRLPASEVVQPSRVAGHEPCGVVAEVGPGVTSVRVGDRVMMHHYTGCNACSMCRVGYTQMCLVTTRYTAPPRMEATRTTCCVRRRRA